MRRSALAVAVAVMLGAIGPATADERRGGFGVATTSSTGGPGNDTLYGGPGNDRFLCGPGFDVAYITSVGDQRRTSGCERVIREETIPQRSCEQGGTPQPEAVQGSQGADTCRG